MDKCPLCQRRIAETDRACECGELLQPWRTITFYGETLRQRGLALAHRKQYLGACLSFVQACLTNPLDDQSRTDVIRSLIHLGEFRDARELIRLFSREIPADEAAALEDAIVELESVKAQPEEVPRKQVAAPPAPKQKPRARRCLALPPIPRCRPLLSRWLPPLSVDALWRTVIQLEMAHETGEGPWTALRQAAADDTVRDYLTGLEHFSRREDERARRSFADCLRNKPCVLNPAAYYLYLSLNTPQTAGEAVKQLQARCRSQDLKVVIRLMEQHLGARLDGARRLSLQHCECLLAREVADTKDTLVSAAPALPPAAVDAVAAHTVVETGANEPLQYDAGEASPPAVGPASVEESARSPAELPAAGEPAAASQVDATSKKDSE
jgi:hypothetical protein